MKSINLCSTVVSFMTQRYFLSEGYVPPPHNHHQSPKGNKLLVVERGSLFPVKAFRMIGTIEDKLITCYIYTIMFEAKFDNHLAPIHSHLTVHMTHYYIIYGYLQACIVMLAILRLRCFIRSQTASHLIITGWNRTMVAAATIVSMAAADGERILIFLLVCPDKTRSVSCSAPDI